VVPQGTLRFALPGVPPPVVRVALRGAVARELKTELDTVIIEPDERRVLLLWRACTPVPGDPLDVTDLEVLESAPAGVR
jgi:hypothetical protein